MDTTISRRFLIAAAGSLLGTAGLDTLAAPNPPAGNKTPGMLRLIGNENPYGPSPLARKAVENAIAHSWKYAIRETGMLKKQIAAYEGVKTSHIMVCAGSSEALRVAAMVFGRNGDRMVTASPTFSFLPTYARSLGCAVDQVRLDETMTHDLDAMEAAVRADTKLVYVCNPNNPTGTLIPGPKLSAFIDEVTPRTPVLVDEAYLDLWDDLSEHTAVSSILAGKPVIVTRTFSKLHGMAGLRVGYAIAPPELIRRMEKLRVTQMSYTGVMAAIASLQDTAFLDYSRARIHECLALTTGVLQELNLPFVPSRGNFVYFDTGGSPREFMAAMRRSGILTGLSYAPYPTWARVSMGRVEDMQVFAEAARSYFSQPD
ncbi:MAG TPA: histidinol-phosphate transaminase [Gammaproteobacteria bacterium]|nr:histidinol-phosphate transaminase [Gammaproteobacteria bacterium]HJP39812.1 histidinol-phosphate transaminase [Gammaproteobacteria bacterium]